MNRLKELRESKGLTQVEFSKMIGNGQTTVSNWERCTRDMDSQTCAKLAKFFCVTVDYLLGVDESQTARYIKGRNA